MPKSISTPKQGGGGGYTFADKVSASFLLKMLAGSAALKTEDGQIESVRFEKRVDGWFLDDIVLHLRGLDDGIVALAISIKSNSQVTKDGFPAEFVTAVWEQRLHVRTGMFDLSKDYLALVTPSLDFKIKSAWDNLLAKAIDADSIAFAARVETSKYDNKIGRALFRSLRCPSSIDASRTPTDTTELLKRLRHFNFDFQSNPSESDNDCIAKCGNLLSEGGTNAASSLWTHLKQIAREFSTSGGDLTRSQLATCLRNRFALKEFPNYVPDWKKLSDDFELRTERIRSKLGGILEFENTAIEAFPNHLVSALIGASGSGKTVFAKQLAIASAKRGNAVWLTPADLNTHSLSTQFRELGIQYSFAELVDQSTSSDGLIVVDGAERLNETGLVNLAQLMRKGKVGTESPPWSFTFTCVADAWERTLYALQREFGEDIETHVEFVEFKFENHRTEILDQFPSMQKTLQRPNLKSIFSNLKILDLVLSNVSKDAEALNWVGETDILEWFWTQHINGKTDGSARSRLLQKMSSIEADNFLFAVPVGRVRK